MHAVMSRISAAVCVVMLLTLIAIEARQAGVQRFDRPQVGARSPRNANYDIDVTLDHPARTLTGRETIRWRNISANPTSELQFHLYWNAWRNADSTWLRERRLAGNVTPVRDDAWGSTDVTRLRVRRPSRADGPSGEQTNGSNGESSAAWIDLTSQQRFLAPDDGNDADRTVMGVMLPFEVRPEETVEVEVEWKGKIPRPFARTGYVDDYYFIAQWFPKLGVLEDRGWNTHQFHTVTEFYSDYGIYDVRITVPREFVVGATGCRVSLTSEPPARCAEGEIAPGNGADWNYRYWAADVHDFAWTASPHFRVSRRTFEHTGLPPVEMQLFLQPEHAGQESRHFDATAVTLRYYGEWFGPYPYSHITIVDPAFQSGSGGMEYPMLFTAGSRWIAPARVPQPEAVTVHEAGHQFWYGIVGSNEFEHAWMDEGLNTFSTARAMDEARMPDRLALRFFGGFVPWVIDDIRLSRATDGNRLSGYRDNAEADAQATPTFQYWPGTATFITYNKTALWLHTLERHLGWPVLQRIMSTYFERWKFRHPQPADFFAVVNEVSGRDMTSFFDQAYRSSNVFDYGVQTFTGTRVRLPPSRAERGSASLAGSVRSRRTDEPVLLGRVAERPDSGGGGPDTTYDGYRTTVVVRRFGEAIFPVDVVTTFRDGQRVTERWDGRDRRAIYTYDRPSEGLKVEVDPERVLLLDVNYTNNSATTEPRAAEASLKWSLKWLVWLQDLMLTYAFFV
jgi:peptidase M1-like protein